MASVAVPAMQSASKAIKEVARSSSRLKSAKKLKKSNQHQLKGVSMEQLNAHPITTFQARVYALTQEIPVGSVTTYGAMAQLLSSSPRAVGQALKRNPFAPIVPCHRVIAQNGLGGFFGHVEGEQMDKKLRLLRQECVPLIDEKADNTAPLGFASVIIDGSCILDATTFEARRKEKAKGYSFPSGEPVKVGPNPTSE